MNLSKRYGKFNVIITHHSLKRMIKRKIPGDKIIKTILSLGQDRLEQYNNSNIDILVTNLTQNYSLVLSITDYNITLITALNKTNCHISKDKQNTIIIAV